MPLRSESAASPRRASSCTVFSRCVTPGYITENGSSGIDFNQDDEQPAYVDFAYLARRFARCEPLRNAGALMLGLLSDLGRKNCWTLSERSGHASPDRLQHLLGRAKWDADEVRDDLRSYVVDHLGDDEAVLVVDETGDVKKGDRTVGVHRQYTGTAGRIENAQVAVYLAYAATAGHTLIDRELYLPKGWVEDPDRRAAAKVPDDTEFATKPKLAADMITRNLDAGAPARWAAGDEVYGADPDLRATLQDRRLGYVLGIGCNRTVPTAEGMRRVAGRITAAPGLAAGQRRDRSQGPALVFVGTARHRRRRTWPPPSADTP